MPEDAFRPLEDWVDYVIETNQHPLAAWVEATRFDFDHFVCTEGGKPPRDPGDGGKGKRRAKGGTDDAPLTPAGPKAATKKPADPGDRRPTQALTAQVGVEEAERVGGPPEGTGERVPGLRGAARHARAAGALAGAGGRQRRGRRTGPRRRCAG